MPNHRYVIRRYTGAGAADVGALYDLPTHAQVCLHTKHEALVELLQARGILAPIRPPFLEAGGGGVHGRYRPRPQINFFLEPPVEDVAEAIRAAASEDGFTVTEAVPVRS